LKIIVGVDFGITDSAIAYAFTTNNEVNADMLTEWSEDHAKRRVIKDSSVLVINHY
jgi:hypothetical protein